MINERMSAVLYSEHSSMDQLIWYASKDPTCGVCLDFLASVAVTSPWSRPPINPVSMMSVLGCLTECDNESAACVGEHREQYSF